MLPSIKPQEVINLPGIEEEFHSCRIIFLPKFLRVCAGNESVCAMSKGYVAVYKYSCSDRSNNIPM